MAGPAACRLLGLIQHEFCLGPFPCTAPIPSTPAMHACSTFRGMEAESCAGGGRPLARSHGGYGSLKSNLEPRSGPRIFVGKLNKDTTENDVKVGTHCRSESGKGPKAMQSIAPGCQR